MAKPPHLLVVNSGSSSLKLSVFQASAKRERLLDAHLSGLNEATSVLEITTDGKQHREEITGTLSVKAALENILSVIHTTYGIEVSPRAIGHRVVHGGHRYSASTLIDKATLSYLASITGLAPLHNPACLEGIKACQELFGTKMVEVAVFDTAFHRTMPPYASQYGIDKDLAARLHIQRYGFHGISHAYLWKTYRRSSIRAKPTSKIITLHLGNGCSMTAIAGGKSLDTSMGFTPAEGLLMGTRAGDIDAGVIEYVCEKENISASTFINRLNHQSGLLGVSGLSSDMKHLLSVEAKVPSARFAIDMFCYRVRKYLGAYLAVLGGADALVFSGGIGENAWAIRERILLPITWCGAILDAASNRDTSGLALGDIRRISVPDALMEVYVIATDENELIAEEVMRLIATH